MAKVIRWIPFVVLFSVVCFFLFQQSPVVRFPVNSDKWAHFLAFVTLVLSARLAVSVRRHYALLLLGLVFFAVVSEVMHGTDFWSRRHFSYPDMAANLLGCFVGYALALQLDISFPEIK